MKNLYISISFQMILAFLLTINVNSQTVINIDNKVIEKPLMSIRGQTLNIQCDTVVLISPYRYRLYEKAKQAILSNDFDKYNELFDAYDTQVRYYKQWNDSLQLKYSDINTLFKTSIENTKNSLNSINNNLSAAKDSMSSANNNLDEALVHLKAAKREKWYYGAIGFLVGSLATILLVSK